LCTPVLITANAAINKGKLEVLEVGVISPLMHESVKPLPTGRAHTQIEPHTPHKCVRPVRLQPGQAGNGYGVSSNDSIQTTENGRQAITTDAVQLSWEWDHE